MEALFKKHSDKKLTLSKVWESLAKTELAEQQVINPHFRDGQIFSNLLTYDKNLSVSQSRYLSPPPAYITPPPQAVGGGEEAFTLFTLADAAWKSHLLEGRGEDHHHHCI